MPRSAQIDRLRRFLQPIHRSIAGLLRLPARRRYLYIAGHGWVPRIKNPVLFTEKVNWRILYDRRDAISWTCDKLEMRDYAAKHAGELGLRVPELLWSGTDLTEIRGKEFGSAWVLKPNHRSGLVRFGDKEAKVDAGVISETRNWLEDDQGVLLGEWAYSLARRQFLIESNISPGADLPDYKFFVFKGRVKLIQLDENRFRRHSRSFYSPAWEFLPVENRFPVADPSPRPVQLEKMLLVAAVLGRPFDFIRVDLYAAHGDVWFGEVTPYPGGGVEPFKPRSFDRWLGSNWQLEF